MITVTWEKEQYLYNSSHLYVGHINVRYYNIEYGADSTVEKLYHEYIL